NTRAWNEPGTAVLFRVGADELALGEYLQRLEGPKFVEGYLPIVQLRYRHGNGEYAQETFASTDPIYASNGVVLSRFGFERKRIPETKERDRVIVRVDTAAPLK